MAVKINSEGKIPVVYSNGEYRIFEQLCCPIGSMALVEEKCCECVYSFNVSAPVAQGCGTSTYYPNRCQPLNFQTPAITIGPLKFIAEISAGPGGITVDDELIVNGSVFQSGLYPVEGGLTGGCTGRTAATNNQCGNCEAFGSTGTGFAPVASTCNGQHTIPEGTVIGAISEGGTMTIAGGDNHGIQVFMSGQIVIKPLGAP
jgi:hypothetical protein